VSLPRVCQGTLVHERGMEGPGVKRRLGIVLTCVLVTLCGTTIILWPLSYRKGWQVEIFPWLVGKSGVGVFQIEVYGGGVAANGWGPNIGPEIIVGPPSSMWREVWGWRWGRFERSAYRVARVLRKPPPPGVTYTLTRWQAPWWSLAALEAVALAFWWHFGIAPARRIRRWTKEGRCLRCGYDLRASVDRCPECGTPKPPGLGDPHIAESTPAISQLPPRRRP
jgi:hypothetical protein